MKVLKGKRAKEYVKRYLESNCCGVSQFYKTGVSAEKLRVEKGIKEYIQKAGGHGYKVICGNSFHFTAGGLLEKNGKTLLYIVTPSDAYEIDIYNI